MSEIVLELIFMHINDNVKMKQLSFLKSWFLWLANMPKNEQLELESTSTYHVFDFFKNNAIKSKANFC